MSQTADKLAKSTNRAGRRRIGFLLAFALLLLVASVVLAEVALRVLGFEPWRIPIANVSVTPGGSLFVRDETLGYRPREGAFRIRSRTGYEYSVTHLADGRRISAAGDRLTPEDSRPEIWLCGCSFTYGEAVNDDQSMAWRLQRRMPAYDVVNYSAPGYGTVQAYVRLRAALAAGERPRLVVVLYFDDHDLRNTLVRQRRKIINTFSRLGPMTQPYVRLDSAGKLQLTLAETIYTEPPLLRSSALVNALEESYNVWELRTVPSHATTEALLREIRALCAASEVPFLLAGLSQSADTRAALKSVREQGGDVADIAFAWQQPENWNWPADVMHPSPLGYARMAMRLEQHLRGVTLQADTEARLADKQTALAERLALARCALEAGMTAPAVDPGRLAEALEHYQQASELDAESWLARLGSGFCLLLAGQEQGAASELRQAAQQNAQATAAARELAWLLATAQDTSLRNPEEALRLAQQASAGESAADPLSLDALAAAQAAAGRFKDAVHTATEALAQATIARKLSLATMIETHLDQFSDAQPLANPQRNAVALPPLDWLESP
jgi:tetratricopeptide (TPR) repeat protein